MGSAPAAGLTWGKESPGEALIIVARALRDQPRKLCVPDGQMSEFDLARVALAIKFDDADPGLKLRALIENWSWERIIRELY